MITKTILKTLPFLLLLLFLLLPFHALGVTVITNFFIAENTPAPTLLKAWKEIILFCIIIFSFFYLAVLETKQRKIYITSFFNLDTLEKVILGFIVVSIIFPFFSIFFDLQNNDTLSFLPTSFLYGIKYTIFPLLLFLFFRRIPLHTYNTFLLFFQKHFLSFSGFFIVLGLFLFFLSQYSPNFFITLGYSSTDSFHSIFQPLSYCQQISHTEICRAQNTLSGPNQLGAYLIFLLSILAGMLVQKYFQKNKEQDSEKNKKNHFFKKNILWILFFLGTLLLFFTFSRGAWIGMFFAGVFFLLYTTAVSHILKIKIFSGTLVFLLLVGSSIAIFMPDKFYKIIHRVDSSSQHLELSEQGLKQLFENPFGKGLGSAGPASKYDSEQGKKEAGFIPENWYLQIGIETGIAGMFLWVLIIFLVIQKLVQKNLHQKNNFMLSLASALFGISIMGLFLHSWESSAVGYSVWILTGILLTKEK